MIVFPIYSPVYNCIYRMVVYIMYSSLRTAFLFIKDVEPPLDCTNILYECNVDNPLITVMYLYLMRRDRERERKKRERKRER